MAFGFWIVALAGLMAAAPIGMAFRTLADRQTRVTERGPPARWRIAIIWFLAAIASLAVLVSSSWASYSGFRKACQFSRRAQTSWSGRR